MADVGLVFVGKSVYFDNETVLEADVLADMQDAFNQEVERGDEGAFQGLNVTGIRLVLTSINN